MSKPAEFRLKKPVSDEKIFARAQAIIDAHQATDAAPLTHEERRVLTEVHQRARRAARNYPNYPVEVSPYVAALLHLED